MDLRHHPAFVTGGGRNIGRAIVLKLAGRGADAAVNTRERIADPDDGGLGSGQMIAANGAGTT